jgi:hypothetical protein
MVNKVPVRRTKTVLLEEGITAETIEFSNCLKNS